jgi:hypothetical protein
MLFRRELLCVSLKPKLYAEMAMFQGETPGKSITVVIEEREEKKSTVGLHEQAGH